MKDQLSIVNDPRSGSEARLAALRSYEKERRLQQGAAAAGAASAGEINNHIHTVYSFSPYTPSMAALKARDAGLEAAGSVDHDSIGAAQEMIAACAILGIGGCAGFELRVSFKTGPDGKPSRFADRKINNPDSPGLVYMTVQGIPTQALPKVREFLKPIQARRNKRNREMAHASNKLLAAAGFAPLDFQKDILDLSQAALGGGVTERHLLQGVALKIIERYGKGRELAAGIEKTLGIKAPEKIAALLADGANPHYVYDLLGLLKTTFLNQVFIQPDEEECITAQKVVDFARSIGAIPAYAYLGDVGESPTGDKKAEKFEDDYLEELFAELCRIGYKAVAYMPPRNTVAQLLRVQKLCAERGFMEISGVDINSSRQSFNCPEVLKSEFRHLVDTTWALIAHERLASFDLDFDLFSPRNPLAALPLAKRLAVYAQAGRDLDRHDPQGSAKGIAEKIIHGGYAS